MLPVALDALSPGVVFANRYRLVHAIARGGMGAVYEVVHLETQRRRALKVILPGLMESEEHRRRFRQEAQVAARIDSEFVVDVFDAGVDEATRMPFLVMELLRGEDLGARLARAGAFTPDEVVAHLHQTALALDRMRVVNVVHRDLKPENLFLSEREDGPPRIKVLDLGIAKVLAEGTSQSQATRSLGTPLYMAPEQLGAASHVTPATDIYALGMIAYTLLVGRPYFAEEAYESGNIFAFALVVRRGPIEPADARAARAGVRVPPAFAAWFARVTAADPNVRIAGAVAAVVALAVALGVTMAPAVSTTRPAPPTTSTGPLPSATAAPLSLTPGPTPVRRSNTAAAVLIVSTLVLGGVGIGVAVFGGRSRVHVASDAASASVVAVQASIELSATRPALPDMPPSVPVDSSAPDAAATTVDAGTLTLDAGARTLDAGGPPRAPPPRPGPARLPAPEPAHPVYTRDL